MPFELPDIPTDPTEVMGRILDALSDNVEGYEPHEGALEVALAEEIAAENAATNARTRTALLTAVAGIGETVFGLAVITAATATVDVRLSVNTLGAVIPAGFTAYGTNFAGETIAFVLAAETVTTTLTPTVTMTAAQPGASANQISGTLAVGTATAAVVSALAVAPSAGGLDAETVEQYAARFADYASILRPGGVRGSDLAALARSVPGVYRALGIDLYDATTGQSGVERTATIVPIDQRGLPVDNATAAVVAEQLAMVREVNFVIRTGTPKYTPINVTYTAVAETSYDPAVVEANVDAAITAWLSPGRWGNAEGGSSEQSTVPAEEVWEESLIVRYLDLARVAGTATGVAYLSALSVNGGQVDVTIPGPAGLPSPMTSPPAGVTASSVSGTVQ